MASAGITISPQGMMRQWAGAVHKFRFNVWNFEVEAGQAAQSLFLESFDQKKFPGGTTGAWPARSPKSKGSHPLLVETGSLKRSIRWKHVKTSGGYNAGVKVFTDARYFAGAKRHKGFCYAAIHNSDSSEGFKTGRAAHIPQRQFMGDDSSILNDKLEKLGMTIFKGFPL